MRHLQGTVLAVSRHLPCVLRSWNLCGKGWQEEHPRGSGFVPAHGGRAPEAANPLMSLWLTCTSGCCSLPLLLLKTFASEDPSRLPCLWVGCIACWLPLKVTQQVWSRTPSSLPFVLFCFVLFCFVLFCSHCSSELCGSFWFHTVQGTSRTSSCGSLLFLFATSVAFYPSLTALSLTAFLLCRPSSLSPI